MHRTSWIVALIASSSSIAFAQTDTGAAPPAVAKPDHVLTVMWAPLRLIVPLVEMTAEYRVTGKVGASITLGGGKRTLDANGMKATGNEIEGGAQARYYVLGDFSHGMEVGAELLYERVHFDEPFPPGIVGIAEGGMTMGPFVGYKVATHLGFTFEGQLGARYLVVEPAVQGSAMGATYGSKWLPILHLNVGWSF